jgi:putative transposase
MGDEPMTSDRPRGHRRSIRLPDYDYAQPGAYFVTLCTAQGERLFGEIVDGVMVESVFGVIAREEWFRSVHIRGEIVLNKDEFVVMPNHEHGIVRIIGDVGATGGSPLPAPPPGRSPLPAPPPGPLPHSLGAVMAGYKAAVTKRINQIRGTPGTPVWQRNYYEHIIRSERALRAIRQYITDNPARWRLDRYNTGADGSDPFAADLWRLLKEETP